MVRHFWEQNSIKGAIGAVTKLPDYSVSFIFKPGEKGIFFTSFLFMFFWINNLLSSMQVQVDVINILKEKTDIFTLDLFSLLLPLFFGLLSSKVERYKLTYQHESLLSVKWKTRFC